jgi:hypothetical protein
MVADCLDVASWGGGIRTHGLFVPNDTTSGFVVMTMALETIEVPRHSVDSVGDA